MTAFESGPLVSGESSPDTVGLVSFERILETLQFDGASVTDLARDYDGVLSHDWIGDILREVELWKPLTGHTASTVDGHEKLAVFMSEVKHRLESIGGRHE